VSLRLALAAAACLALVPTPARAGALAECQKSARAAAEVANCLAARDLDALAALKQAEDRAAYAAREQDERAKRGGGAYTALAKASRAFALYQGAHCDYVAAIMPGGNERARSADPTEADLARVGCRIDLARQRIEILKN